jgi:hypothetical protein
MRKLPRRLEGAQIFAAPAHVMLGGFWGSLSSPIYVAVDDVFGF